MNTRYFFNKEFFSFYDRKNFSYHAKETQNKTN